MSRLENIFELPELQEIYPCPSNDLMLHIVYTNSRSAIVSFLLLDALNLGNKNPFNLPELLEMYVCPGCSTLYALYGDDNHAFPPIHEIPAVLKIPQVERTTDYAFCSVCEEELETKKFIRKVLEDII